MSDTRYFAYGSNMNEDQFKGRCPSSHMECRAVLDNYRWIINERGVATVVKHEGASVHGVLYAITESDEKELDRWEGVAGGCYNKDWLLVRTDLGDTVEALVYVDPRTNPGRPKKGYLEKVLAGARLHDLPEAYLRELERWKTS
ncbi:MAG: gamma-glutamylcyclotransferase family protein [Verrucomicrobiia bacterium]